MKKLLLSLLMLLPLMASAEDVEVDGIRYQLTTAAEAFVTSLSEDKYSGDIIIPNSITYNEVTYIVLAISSQAFKDCTGLTSIEIPNSVIDIGYKAFEGCTNLSSIVIPNSVTTISTYAFSGCTNLSSIELPNSVTDIYGQAFEGCTNLSSITIPNSVTSIEFGTFQNCSNLSSIDIPNSVTSIKGNAFKDCSKLSAIDIPNGVTSIGEYAFYNCSSLTSLTIPNGVPSIGEWAFWGCSSLASISIPNSITSIGEWAFYDCRSLSSLNIPAGVTSIGEGVFYGCSRLTSITIPAGVTSIGDKTFYNCSSLNSITIPNSLTSIGEWAFHNCSSLASITIPTNLTSIGKYAFANCSSLASITIPDGVTSIMEGIVSGCTNLKTITIPNNVTAIGASVFAGCSSLTSITIPDGVTSLEFATFSGCSSLTSITIPNSVTSLGFSVFYGCSGLTSITIPNGVTTIWGDAFMECSGLQSVTSLAVNPPLLKDQPFYNYGIPLYVPYASLGKYKEAGGWSNFTNILAFDAPATKYKLIYKVDGEVYKTYELSEGDAITPEAAPTKEGYTFSGWSDIPSKMPAKDVTVTGTFTINKYKLIYKVDGEEYKQYEIEYGAKITPEPAPTKEGYSFSGWSTIPETMPAEDVTITGTFSKGAYKLTYMVDGVVYKTVSYDYGDAITPEAAPTKEGYTFSGWSEIPKTMPAEDVTVKGSFTINKYKLIYMVDGAEYKKYEIEYGAKITPEAVPTKEGYTFSGWSTIPETMPAKDVTITGTFTKNEEQQDDPQQDDPQQDDPQQDDPQQDDPQTEITKEDVVYEIEGGTVTVTQSDNATGAVKIEASVEISGKTYEVTVIAKEAFKESTGITAVDIPNSITSIGEKAFEGCTGLRLIEIGKGIKEIASKAFANIFKSNARTRGGDDGLQVYCEADAVPNTASDAFEGTDISNATLHVPESLIDTYKVTAPWKGFGTIVGLSTGIKTISIDKSDVLIFDMQGNRLNNFRKGLNIIRTKDGKTKKVVVK